MSDAPAYLGRVLSAEGAPKGTCFQIAPAVVVTAWHVLRSVEAAAVGAPVSVDPLAGGEPIGGRVLAVDPDRDLATVRLNGSLSGTIVGLVSAHAVRPHTPVMITGVPTLAGAETFRFTHATGHWLGVAEREDKIPRGQVEANAVVPGMSGGPLRLAADDRVIGVVSARYNSATEWAQHTVWVARSDDIKAVLPDDVKVPVEEVVTAFDTRLGGSGAAAAQAERLVRLSARPTILVGRDDLMVNLDRHLPIAKLSTPAVVFLTGMGGIGKTSVALEYAHRNSDRYDLIWQLAADDTSTMTTVFAELARHLGLRSMLDQADPVQLVHVALANRVGKWLLLFDNVMSPDEIRGFIPSVGDGHILVTSQHAHWPPSQCLEVPTLVHSVAAALLESRAGETEHAVANDLAEQLGGLPLALEQAGAYMRATGLSLREYAALFALKRRELLERGAVHDYDKRVSSTWSIAFDRLTATSPEAISLLRLLACFASDVIPFHGMMRARRESLSDLRGGFDPRIDSLLLRNSRQPTQSRH